MPLFCFLKLFFIIVHAMCLIGLAAHLLHPKYYLKLKIRRIFKFLPESMISKRRGHLLCSANLIHWTPWMFLPLILFLCSLIFSTSFAHKEVRAQGREASLSCPRFISTPSTSFDGVFPLKLRSLFSHLGFLASLLCHTGIAYENLTTKQTTK